MALREAVTDELNGTPARIAEHSGTELLVKSSAIGLDVLGRLMQIEATVLMGAEGRHAGTGFSSQTNAPGTGFDARVSLPPFVGRVTEL